MFTDHALTWIVSCSTANLSNARNGFKQPNKLPTMRHNGLFPEDCGSLQVCRNGGQLHTVLCPKTRRVLQFHYGSAQRADDNFTGGFSLSFIERRADVRRRASGYSHSSLPRRKMRLLDCDGVVTCSELQAGRRTPNEFTIDSNVCSVWF